MSDVRRTRRPAAGVWLSCLEAGPDSGPLVILLHGFPEAGESWARQIDVLAKAGFHVLAPDQRGYVDSDKPRGVPGYRLDVLAKDIVALAAAVGSETFDLAGHDWGGLVAWEVAIRYPGPVRRLAILNAPHPLAFTRYAIRHPSQLRRSAYMAMFQIPRLPEALLRRNGFGALAATLQRSSGPGAFDAADLERYRIGWAAPGALTGMLNWYRALPQRRRSKGSQRITAPTLVLWGAKDIFLNSDLAALSAAYCDDGRVEAFDDATHWLHHEEAAAIGAALVGFFG